MAVLGPILELMRLRAGPQDMPGSRGAVAWAAGLYLIAGIAQLLVLEAPGPAVTLALLTTVLLAIYTAALLLWRGTPNRFRQTATALFASGTVFTVIMLGPDLAMAPYLKAVQHTQATQSASHRGPGAAQSSAVASGNSVSPSQEQSTDQSAGGGPNPNAGQPPDVPAPAAWAFLLFVAIGLWRLVVFSHIYREALETTRWMGLAAAIGFELFLLAVFALV